MHTAQELDRTMFGFRLDGRTATLQDVLPDLRAHDRLGVVVREPCGAVGASILILAAVTAFYDRQRARTADFFAYPDFFLFHVGSRLGDHGMLDVWPAHKEVVVQGGGEPLLRAINDRAITRLLIADRPRGDPPFERQTVASARDRIATAMAYAPTGRIAEADVRVRGNAVTESCVAAVLDRSTGVPAAARQALAGDRRRLHEDGAPVEAYRRLTLDDALARL